MGKLSKRCRSIEKNSYIVITFTYFLKKSNIIYFTLTKGIFMYKAILSITALFLLSSCATTQASFQDKVQDRVKEKTTDTLLTKVGLKHMVKPKKTTTQKLLDVSKGTNTIENVVVDIAVDKTANSLLDKVSY